MPGLILFLGASRVSFQPGIDPFGLQPNRTPAAHARVPGRRICALCNVQPRLHRATLLTRHRVTQPLSNRSSVGALWRADLRPARRNRGARCGLVLPASKTGALSAAVVVRLSPCVPERWVTLAVLFSRMARRYSHVPGDTARRQALSQDRICAQAPSRPAGRAHARNAGEDGNDALTDSDTLTGSDGVSDPSGHARGDWKRAHRGRSRHGSSYDTDRGSPRAAKDAARLSGSRRTSGQWNIRRFNGLEDGFLMGGHQQGDPDEAD